MQPHDLKAEDFVGYLPEARVLVVAHLSALQQLPLSFVPLLLREAIDYDYKFPTERTAIDRELANLSALTPSQLGQSFAPFRQLALSPKLEELDWVNYPAQFVEQESAHLWTTHQQDAFRKAATEYGDRLRTAMPPEPLPMRRLGIAIIGQGVTTYDAPLFRNLRAHGIYFSHLKPENGVSLLLKAAAARAKAHPLAYGHWYVDGGNAAACDDDLHCISYSALEPVRSTLLKNIQTEVARPGMGPEELRTHLARIAPT